MAPSSCHLKLPADDSCSGFGNRAPKDNPLLFTCAIGSHCLFVGMNRSWYQLNLTVDSWWFYVVCVAQFLASSSL